MRSGDAGHVSPSEWRWVIVASVALALVAFLPFFWIIVFGLTGSDWQFMGLLHDYQDGATSLARVFQGTERSFLTEFLHSPEPQDPTLIDLIYVLIGQLSRFIAMSPVALFHAARVAASVFMYMALYQLAATIWVRIRTRRIFFILVTAGSGAGWLLAPLFNITDMPDLTTPQAYPFFSTLANVHYPLSIALISMIVSIIVVVFRPGSTEAPTIENGGVMAFLGGLVLVLISPLAYLPIILTLLIGLALIRRQKRERFISRLWWLLWFVAPALPVLLYYAALLEYNVWVAKIWEQLNQTPVPSPLILIFGLGGVLIVAVPGLFRAIRRFEADGDQFMLIWMVLIVILIYIPSGGGMQYAAGLMIPIAYFATRAIEDFWFDYIPRRWRLRLMVLLLPIIVMSHILILIIPLQPVADGNFAQVTGIVLERGYLDVFSWIRGNTDRDDVILASPTVGLWVPAWTGARTVYGHPIQTIEAKEKHQAVLDWYRAKTEDECKAVLEGKQAYGAKYQVKYVIVGPAERRLGNTVCLNLLTPLLRADDVFIYRYDPDNDSQE